MRLVHCNGGKPAFEQMTAPSTASIDEIDPAAMRGAQSERQADLILRTFRSDGRVWASGNSSTQPPTPCAFVRPGCHNRSPSHRPRRKSARAGFLAPPREADSPERRSGRGEACEDHSRIGNKKGDIAPVPILFIPFSSFQEHQRAASARRGATLGARTYPLRAVT